MVQARWVVLREDTGRRSQVRTAGVVALRMAQERSNAAGLAAGACWVRCMAGIQRMEVLEVVLEVGIPMAASGLHKEVAAAAVEEADMMIGGDASGIVVGGSVAVGTWKTQEAPHSLAWL
jgi:hypothetical protein